MTSRTTIGIALGALVVVAPAIVIGSIFGFDETFASGSHGTGQFIAMILALLSGFFSGLGITHLSRGDRESSRWPQVDAVAKILRVYEKEDSNRSRPSGAHA
jgi:hypothetical protein